MVCTLITGSSGFVASDLILRFKEKNQIFGIDVLPSRFTDLNFGIESAEFKLALEELSCEEVNVINLAAARFDFGANAKDYFYLNVECHELFLHSLLGHKIKKFVHVSSVASFDGRDISYSEKLNCDDAYRSTKYMQEVLIKKWCKENDVDLTILYPSAIFSQDARSDTNIGKMQTLSRYIPFVPEINVDKSLTYLPKFSKFIMESVNGKLPSGQYMTIEKPILTVSKMIQILSGRSIFVLRIPGLRLMLKIIAKFLFIIGGFGKVDMKLTPNRIAKLFSDTAYAKLNDDQVDFVTYNSNDKECLMDILKNFENSH